MAACVSFFFRFGCGEAGFLKARFAGSVVQTPVVQAWYGSPLCRLPVVGSRVLCWAWFQIEARYAGRDRVLGVIPFKARYADVVPCRCGRRMRVASER